MFYFETFRIILNPSSVRKVKQQMIREIHEWFEKFC